MGQTLRPYQTECIDQAVKRKALLIAMVMGAGKTAATLRTVRSLRRDGEVTSGAVFVLNSNKFQWLEEVRKWDPGALVQVVDGDKRSRTTQLQHSSRYHYTILHYETLVHDWETIQKHLPIDFIVGDEITAIKGFTAKRSRRLKAMGKHTEYRYGLSGQPVENRPEELFSIMEFVDPEVLGPFNKFDRTFIKRDYWGRPKSYMNLGVLRDSLGEAMFRKSREDIKDWLPDLVELEMPVRLGKTTMALHDLIRDDLLKAIDEAMASGAVGGGFDLLINYGKAPKDKHSSRLKGAVMARLLAMRMLSSHPSLLQWSADGFDTPDVRHGSQYASYLRQQGALDGLPKHHEKLDSLLEMIESIQGEDPRHKIVVFSYFKPMLRLIALELAKMKIRNVSITGDISTGEREVARQRFNYDSSCKVLLSSDAGAYGVDLKAGSHLVCYDLPWSAGILKQRIARIDRTSSSWGSITIGYMYGKGTIEERMYQMLKQKMAIAEAFLDGKFNPKTGALPLDFASLREFLLAA